MGVDITMTIEKNTKDGYVFSHVPLDIEEVSLSENSGD